jgi:sigma-B regulation protein RsbU (phosphoserine phosphatase)
MTFSVKTQESTPDRVTLGLHGRLDAMSFGDFDNAVVPPLAQIRTGGTLVLDLSGLDYISSAGLRSIAKIRKAMRARNGHSLLLNPQPQVQKVFDIVKAVPLSEVFTSAQELDAYLDGIQRKIIEGDDGAE